LYKERKLQKQNKKQIKKQKEQEEEDTTFVVTTTKNQPRCFFLSLRTQNFNKRGV
jgi:hypothetical protein